MSNEERDKVINWLSELMTLPKSAVKIENSNLKDSNLDNFRTSYPALRYFNVEWNTVERGNLS